MKIKLHWSLLVGVILGTFVFSLYGIYYWLAGLITLPFTLLFGLGLSVGMYASILLHECGHYFIAEYYGIKVEEINLWGLSAYTKVAKNECTPNLWVLRAASGIYANILIGCLLLIVSSLIDKKIVSYFLDILGLLNLGLGLTNLIPFKTRLGGTDGYNLIINLYKVIKG
jgi:Zn-dependent protease